MRYKESERGDKMRKSVAWEENCSWEAIKSVANKRVTLKDVWVIILVGKGRRRRKKSNA